MNIPLPSRPDRKTLFFLYCFLGLIKNEIVEMTGWSMSQIATTLRESEFNWGGTLWVSGQIAKSRVLSILRVDEAAYSELFKDLFSKGRVDWRMIIFMLCDVEDYGNFGDQEINQWALVLFNNEVLTKIVNRQSIDHLLAVEEDLDQRRNRY